MSAMSCFSSGVIISGVHGNLRSRRRGRPARSTAGTEGATPLQSAVDVRAWATVVSAPTNRPYPPDDARWRHSSAPHPLGHSFGRRESPSPIT